MELSDVVFFHAMLHLVHDVLCASCSPFSVPNSRGTKCTDERATSCSENRRPALLRRTMSLPDSEIIIQWNHIPRWERECVQIFDVILLRNHDDLISLMITNPIQFLNLHLAGNDIQQFQESVFSFSIDDVIKALEFSCRVHRG